MAKSLPSLSSKCTSVYFSKEEIEYLECMRTGSKYKIDESINEMKLRLGINNNQSY